MGATGSTPTYYDFDMFQEMSVTTGGADAQNPTPGVQLNLVLKKGSNTPHGNARIYFENESLQANNMPADLAASIGGTAARATGRIAIKDDGFDLGGPICQGQAVGAGASLGQDRRPQPDAHRASSIETKLKNRRSRRTRS